MSEFQIIKRSKQKKKKLMLWVDLDLVDFFEELPPSNITVQEKMRQVLRHFADGGLDELRAGTQKDDLEGL